MDQVTQSNSAQTEELSATAQALSEQAQRLREMVGAFTLRRSNTSRFGAASPSRASASLRAPEAVAGLTRKPRSGGSAGKNGTASRASKPKVIRQPVTTLVTAVQPVASVSGSASDDSFEEF
jgi:hypothetical protein